MKKTLLALLVIAIVVGSVAWVKRTDILLAFVKYRFASINTGPEREVPWQQGPIAADSTKDDPVPNIILIVADDLGYNDISTFGGGLIETPNIDQLAAEGAVFTQSYSGASTCAPSRAMMMTGRYPTRTGFEFTPTPAGMGKMVSSISQQMDNNLLPSFYDEALEATHPAYEFKGLPTEEVTVAEMLKTSGYYTAHVGKWHLGRTNGMAPHQQGFDDSLLMASGLYLPENDPNVVNAKLSFDPIDPFLWAAMIYA
ncbi:MAG: sulfatase-like hydrolase/transferase, partial [Porticoccaceae bacterium]|nr:sulfatase-like hydrolase/transferase [Porticoccaceae bacterium]